MSGLLGTIQSVKVLEKTKTVDLGEFDEVFRGAVFEVWLTPTRDHVEAWKEIRDWLTAESERARLDRDAIRDKDQRKAFDQDAAARLQRGYDRRLDAWLAVTWRNVGEDEVTAIHEHLAAVAPAAWDWLVSQTHTAIGEFRRRASGN